MGAYELEDAYANMLDECYGEVEICGFTYAASVALRNVDQIAYRVGLSEYEANLENDEEVY